MGKLGEAWERHAAQWIAWARAPGHDSYWQFHRDAFLELVPPPSGRTLDVGCGEGRLARDLVAVGHAVVGVDSSPTLVEAARTAAPESEFHVADAAALPFDDGAFALVVAFMSLQDVTISAEPSARRPAFSSRAAGSAWPSSIRSAQLVASQRVTGPRPF